MELVRSVGVDADDRLARPLKWVGEAGDQPPLAALSAGLIALGLATRNPALARAGLRAGLSLGLATVVKSAIKKRIDRSRPHHALDAGDYRLEAGSSRSGHLQSMPSGHSAGSAAVARAIGRELPVARAPAGIAAVIIMLAQLPRRAHFPSDVLAGAAVGLLAEGTVAFGWRRFARAIRPAPRPDGDAAGHRR